MLTLGPGGRIAAEPLAEASTANAEGASRHVTPHW
jgi:hypothetical protein